VLTIKAEIMAVGDELCYGRVYDTNSFWLADQLTRRGIFVTRITCVRDDCDEICEVLKDVIRRGSDFVFITGGLGPTEDDKTLGALSRISGRRIVISDAVLKVMGERRKIPPGGFLPHQLKMASTIEGAECLLNPVGWAPVTVLRIGNCTVFALPGPPREMQACFNEHLASRIQEATGYRSYAKRILVTMYESEIAPIVAEVAKNLDGVYLKPLVSEGSRDQGLGVEVIVFDLTEEGCLRKYQRALGMLKELVAQKGRSVIEQ
jgi:molybdenum cofactor synthesis domain-containing protein